MPKIITIGHLTTADKEGRAKLIEVFEKIAAYSRTNEPGVTKYAITVPVDETDEKTIYMIEEYADQATSDAHLASQPVQDLIALMTSDPTLLAGPPAVYQLEPIYSSTKPEIADAKSPHIVFANLDYKPEGIKTSLPYWEKVASTSEKDEPGTLFYAVTKTAENPDQLHTVEVYESEKYLWDVHAKSQAVQDSVANTKHLRTGLKHAHLQLVGGFWYK